LREGTIDFNNTVGSGRGGTSSLNLGRVSEPVSGGSIVSWAELLKQQQGKPSDPDVVIGSLPEIQIDSSSDHDILRHLEKEGGQSPAPGPSGGEKGASGIPLPPPRQSGEAGGVRKGIRAGATVPIPKPGDSKHGTVPLPPPDAQGGSMASKMFTPQAPGKQDWLQDKPGSDQKPPSSMDLQSSSIDLRTAGNIGLGEGSKVRDESDVLAHALSPDDGGSAVNLGVEPRVNNLMSNPSLLQKVAAMRAVVPGPIPAQGHLAATARPAKGAQQVVAWIGGAAIGVALATGF